MEKNKKNPNNQGGGGWAFVIGAVLIAGMAAAGGGDKEPPKSNHAIETVTEQKNKDGEPVWKTGITLDKLIDTSKGTEKHAYIGVKHFWEYGYSKEQSVGMICNFMGEGSKLDPGQHQYGGGPGRGIAQWEGSRRNQLYAYADKHSKRWDDYKLQLNFATHELQTTESRADSHIRETDTVWGAIAAAVRSYERPRDQSDSQIERRYAVCEPILGKLVTVMELDLAA